LKNKRLATFSIFFGWREEWPASFTDPRASGGIAVAARNGRRIIEMLLKIRRLHQMKGSLYAKCTLNKYRTVENQPVTSNEQQCVCEVTAE